MKPDDRYRILATTDYTYVSFGKSSQTGTLSQRYGFTGRGFDAESGLIYFRARRACPNLRWRL